MQDIKQRCIKWTIRTQVLLVVLLLALVLVVTLLVVDPSDQNRIDGLLGFAPLTALWLTWLFLQISNYQMVKCGPLEARFSYCPKLINRPDLYIRLSCHVLINWSAVLATFLVAWRLQGHAFSNLLAWLTLVTTILVWLVFNLLHRQFNRIRNITLSSALALIFLFGCVYLLVTSGSPSQFAWRDTISPGITLVSTI